MITRIADPPNDHWQCPKEIAKVSFHGALKDQKGDASNRKLIPPKSGISCFVTNMNTQPLNTQTNLAVKCICRWCSHMAAIRVTNMKTVIPVNMGADSSDINAIQNTAKAMQNLISMTDI